jgi:hypothetical protein
MCAHQIRVCHGKIPTKLFQQTPRDWSRRPKARTEIKVEKYSQTYQNLSHKTTFRKQQEINTIFVTGTQLAPSGVENCNLRKELKQAILKNLSHPTDLLYYLLTSSPVMRIEVGEIFKPNWLMDLSNTPAISFRFPDLGSVPAYSAILSVSILSQFRYF